MRAVVSAAVLALAACSSAREPPLVFGTGQATEVEIPASPPKTLPPMSMNDIAVAYVKLVLALGEIDPGYVDAYYGPPEWAEQARALHLDAREIERQSQQLMVRLLAAPAEDPPADPELGTLRKGYLKNQLGSLSARAAMLNGRKFSFDDECLALYDVAAPHYSEAGFEAALKQLDALLPREPGSLAERYNRYIERFAVPKEKLQSVMSGAINYAQLRVRTHLELPRTERFELALVGGKPWSAYNWYQGGYYSRIEVNADLPVTISRVVELASHEGYPGHHVYNSLLEKDLVRGQNWPEYQVYALYSPQSFIAEGSADYGVELTFPGRQRLDFEHELFDLSGLDTGQLETYDRIRQAAESLGPATIEAARRYLDGQMDAASTAAWLQHFTLASPERARQRVQFFDHYRAYIVNYAYGKEMVRRYVEKHGDGQAGSDAQWRAFVRLLSTPRAPSELD